MHYARLLAAVALASAVALGCTDQQPPMAPATDLPIASSATADRSTGPFFALGFGNDQYTALIGATLENWLTFCQTGEENWDDWEILTVTRPDGSQKTTTKGSAQHLLVWQNPADLCADTPDYSGIVRSLATDSDVDLSGNGADASGHRVRGIVSDASGQRYRFHSVFQLTVAPPYTLDNFVIVWHSQKITIRPIK
jgi:hypothetical protein